MEKQEVSDIEKYKLEFIKNMDDKTKKAFEIAKSHLESSFDLEKSISFQEYLQKKNKK